MATSRQERMQERMRGAGRHQVEDISFAFVLPVEGEESIPTEEQAQQPAAAPSPPAKSPTPTPPAAAPASRRPTPNTSAKRKQLASENSPPPFPAASPPTAAPPPQSQPPESPPDVVAPTSPAQNSVTTTPPRGGRSTRRQSSSGLRRRVSYAEEVEVRETDEVTGRLSSKRTSVPLSSPVAAGTPLRAVAVLAEEVGESPADAPGSGRRRLIQVEENAPVMGSSTLLQRVLDELDETVEDGDEAASSSPVERMKANRRGVSGAGSVRSAASASSRLAGTTVGTRRRSPRLSGGSSVAEREIADELSSPVVLETDDGGQEISGLEAVAAPPDDQEEEEAVAEEITEKEAARRLGRKRPRRSMPAASPELDSGLIEREEPEAEEEPEPGPEPAAKRRRTKKLPASPAIQQQPKTKGAKTKAKPPVKEKPQAKEKPPPKKQAAKRGRNTKYKGQEQDHDDEGAGKGSVPITVQRFIKNKGSAAERDSNEEGGDADIGDDIFTADIPFANRTGVNVIDVLTKLCEELTAAYLERIQERHQAAEDAASKREQRTMARALEAFQEELRTRLLEHTIALDTLHALRKRVRVAQKEKLALRDEIMRIRAERDQVGLRMDAVRLKHEADSKVALRRISLSSALHDIDLVVERGRAAGPPPSAADRKKAELRSLEMLVMRVADQVCPSRGGASGALKQIRDFNAFLERAAGALEGRGK